jgi:hypothetical protein
MNDFTRVLHLGKGPAGNVFAKVEYKDGRLSFGGVEGPLGNGNCRGSAGQIGRAVLAQAEAGTLALALGWDEALVRRFLAIWERWHLNDLRAGTPAQEAYLRAHKLTGANYYERACDVLAVAGLNPDDGYYYGGAWLREKVPTEVLDFLLALPGSELVPAWV